MTTSNNAVRALVVYSIITPLTLLLGWVLALNDPRGAQFWFWISLVILSLAMPLLLKWHRPMLFLAWNMTAVIFFLPGQPTFWLLMAFVSLLLSLVQRTLVRDVRFIHAPSIILPLLFLGLVVLVTAEQNGFGLRIFGDATIGGKRYLLIFGAIIGCLAMITRPIPPQKAMFFVGLFFLGAITDAIGNAISFVGPSWYYIFYVFPVENVPTMFGAQAEIVRYGCSGLALMGIYMYLLARYGVREMLGIANAKRLLLLLLVAALTMGSGFRSYFIIMGMIFLVLFWMEGLFRTRYGLWLVISVILAGVVVVPLATRLPLSVQRTLSILPIEVDPIARQDAEHSIEWRVEMWDSLWPDVPKYLWFGKGLSFEEKDLELTDLGGTPGLRSGAGGAATVGDFHNGPLTILIPFGIWGAIGLVWFFAASLRAMYLNYTYGDERLKKINALLLGTFLCRTFFYLVIFGNFATDIAMFAGLIGLNLALNGGIRKPVRIHTVVRPVTLQRPVALLKPANANARG